MIFTNALHHFYIVAGCVFREAREASSSPAANSPRDRYIFSHMRPPRWSPGQRATISVDAYGKKYNGHVESIAGASGALFSMLPPENATGNYVKVVQRIPVKITFDPGETKEHILRPGMSVEPKVWVR